ncbi:hypothetical protein [Chryseobacterium sp.]|uniref:hypothetical protein n=1 Tax=Chryseobacterium sp. TaxID=1871047 RepID=UPI0035B4F67C
MGVDYYGMSQEWSESDLIGIIESVFERNEMFVHSVKDIVEDILLNKSIEEILKEENKETEDSIKRKTTSCSVQVSILNELVFFDLQKVKEMTSTQKEYTISCLLNRGEREVKGNINVLNPNSKEDVTRYTASTHGTIAKAKKIINEKN